MENIKVKINTVVAKVLILLSIFFLFQCDRVNNLQGDLKDSLDINVSFDLKATVANISIANRDNGRHIVAILRKY